MMFAAGSPAVVALLSALTLAAISLGSILGSVQSQDRLGGTVTMQPRPCSRAVSEDYSREDYTRVACRWCRYGGGRQPEKVTTLRGRADVVCWVPWNCRNGEIPE